MADVTILDPIKRGLKASPEDIHATKELRSNNP